jgi:hypothetical protein
VDQDRARLVRLVSSPLGAGAGGHVILVEKDSEQAHAIVGGGRLLVATGGDRRERVPDSWSWPRRRRWNEADVLHRAQGVALEDLEFASSEIGNHLAA